MLTRHLTCALAMAALTLAAACHDEHGSFSQAMQQAHSTPLPPSSAVSAPETTAAPTREVSLRPLEIPFDKDTSPCDLLLTSQVARLAGDRRKPTPVDTDPEWRSPTCHFGGPTRSWTITTVTGTGVEALYDVHKLHGQLQVGRADPIATAFPAYTAVDPARVALSCYLAIDIANAQMLVIGIELTPPVKLRRPCTEVRPIAEEVMRTLIT